METENTNLTAEHSDSTQKSLSQHLVRCEKCGSMISADNSECPICAIANSSPYTSITDSEPDNTQDKKTYIKKTLTENIEIVKVLTPLFVVILIIVCLISIGRCSSSKTEKLLAVRDVITPYFDTLNKELKKDDSIDLSKELYEALDNTELFGIDGTVETRTITLDDIDITAVLTWTSNSTCTQQEYDNFKNKLDKVKDGSPTSDFIDKVLSDQYADDYSIYKYLWIHVGKNYLVTCKYENNTIFVKWYSEEAYDNYYEKKKSMATPRPEPTQTPAPTTAPTKPPQHSTQQSNSGKTNKNEVLCGIPCVFSDYQVTYNSFSLSSDYEGNSVIIENLTFKNLSTTARSFFTTASVTMYQDGIELEHAYIVDGYDAGPSQRKIQQGADLDVQTAHVLRNKTSPVIIEISDWISFNGIKYTGIIPLS